jgi:putative oxidoreductase
LVIFAELFCSGLVAVGFATRAAAVPVLITMATAFFLIHGGDPFPRKELAFVYGVGFLTLIFTGGGHLRLGQLLGR